eukprot:jgi/Ulvmu1/5740/UM245_0008.1
MKRAFHKDGDGDRDGDSPEEEQGTGEASQAGSRLAQFRFEGGTDSRFKSPAKRPTVVNETAVECSLAPLLPAHSDVTPQYLVLGSAPSVESLAQQRYYAHRFNHFWPVVARVFDVGCSAEAFVDMEYSARVNHLCGAGVVVWDMCKDFVRPGSSDSKLTCKQANDIESILTDYPSIEKVGLNGQAAFNLFKKHIVKAGKLPRPVQFVCLPSTSPLNAMKNAIDVKAAKWRECFGLDDTEQAQTK